MIYSNGLTSLLHSVQEVQNQYNKLIPSEIVLQQKAVEEVYNRMGILSAYDKLGKQFESITGSGEQFLKIHKIFSSQFWWLNKDSLPYIESDITEDEIVVSIDMGKRIRTVCPELERVSIEETKIIQSIIHDIQRKKTCLHSITPYQFEDLIEELLRKKGFDVTQTKRTRDGGYDMLALVKGLDNSPLKYIVECKHFSPERKVGVNVIRSFTAIIDRTFANKGLIITSSSFTRDALVEKRMVEDRISLHDHNAIMNWIAEY